MTTEEKNRLLAEFMGWTKELFNSRIIVYKTNDNYILNNIFGWCELKDFKFHTSFDWLMPVWQKLRGDLISEANDSHDEHGDLCLAKCSYIGDAILDCDITTAFDLIAEAIQLINKE